MVCQWQHNLLHWISYPSGSICFSCSAVLCLNHTYHSSVFTRIPQGTIISKSIDRKINRVMLVGQIVFGSQRINNIIIHTSMCSKPFPLLDTVAMFLCMK